jgi:hypothetical protein
MNMHLNSLESNFVLVSFDTWTITTKYTQMIYGRFVMILNFFWCHVQNLLNKNLIYWHMLQLPPFLTHKLWFNFTCFNMHHTLPTNIWFFLLTIPFTLACMDLLFALQYYYKDCYPLITLKSLKSYSPPPSHLITLIFFFSQIFHHTLRTLNLSNTTNLVFIV